jgi:4a-hydroxytetrahydrobiopterin dehydratase
MPPCARNCLRRASLPVAPRAGNLPAASTEVEMAGDDRKRLADDEVPARLARLDGWEREGNWIRKEYRFADFAGAMEFVNHVARTAEELDHHPDIDIRFNRVRLLTSTHSSGGLTEMDFDLARRIDAGATR